MGISADCWPRGADGLLWQRLEYAGPRRRDAPETDKYTGSHGRSTRWRGDDCGASLLRRRRQAWWSLPARAMPLEDAREPHPFIKTTFGVSHGQFSPDGRFVAFTSTRNRRREIFIMDADGSAPHPLVEMKGNSFTPNWSQ